MRRFWEGFHIVAIEFQFGGFWLSDPSSATQGLQFPQVWGGGGGWIFTSSPFFQLLQIPHLMLLQENDLPLKAGVCVCFQRSSSEGGKSAKINPASYPEKFQAEALCCCDSEWSRWHLKFLYLKTQNFYNLFWKHITQVHFVGFSKNKDFQFVREQLSQCFKHLLIAMSPCLCGKAEHTHAPLPFIYCPAQYKKKTSCSITTQPPQMPPWEFRKPRGTTPGKALSTIWWPPVGTDENHSLLQ